MAATPCHIFVTGPPGVGKSTLIQRVLQQLQLPDGAARGFYTEEVRAGGERIGFDVVTLEGQRGPLARATDGAVRRGVPVVGKYRVDVGSFEALSLPALAPQPGTRLLVIDEVGKMELFSPAFFPAVTAALGSSSVLVLGTLPTPRMGRTIPQVEEVRLRPNVRVVGISRESRDRAAQEVLQEVRRQLKALQQSGGGGGSNSSHT